MLISGSRSVHLKTERSQVTSCPNCKANGTLVNTISSKHFHIYWIPIFAYSKPGSTKCESCGHVMKGFSMPEDVRDAYEDFREGTKPKFWQFTGTMIIAAIFLYLFAGHVSIEAQEIAYIKDPMKGDVYYYEADNGDYSSMIVRARMSDSLFVSKNKFESSYSSGVEEIDYEVNYLEERVGYDISTILNMYYKGKIFKVYRY